LSKDAPERKTGSRRLILRDAALRAAPQDEVVGCGSNAKNRLGVAPATGFGAQALEKLESLPELRMEIACSMKRHSAPKA
jgi:hypothetical protein